MNFTIKSILVFTSLLFFFGYSQSQDTLESKKYVKIAQKIFNDNYQFNDQLKSQQALTEAVKYLNKALEIDSTNTNALENKITIFKILGKTSEMVEPIEKLLLLKPDYAESYLQLGAVYEYLQSYDLANITYKKAERAYLISPPSDYRNYHLVFITFLLTRDKNVTLKKVKELEFKDSEELKNLYIDIDEWCKGNIF